MFGQYCCAFSRCERLAQVELVGDIHETISLLALKEWQHAMNEAIDGINLLISDAKDKTIAIRDWLISVQDEIDRYKFQHNKLLKESLSLIELFLWKIKLDELEKSMLESPTKKAKIDKQCDRKETKTIFCQDTRAQGRLDYNATAIIGNVLPFLYKLMYNNDNL